MTLCECDLQQKMTQLSENSTWMTEILHQYIVTHFGEEILRLVQEVIFTDINSNLLVRILGAGTFP